MWNGRKNTQFHNVIKYVYKKLKKADNFIQRIHTSMKTEKCFGNIYIILNILQTKNMNACPCDCQDNLY